MPELIVSNFIMMFIIIGMGLPFVIIWVIKSETKINASKLEISRLNAQLETYEREKFALAEKLASLEDSQGGSCVTGEDFGRSLSGSDVSEGLIKSLHDKNEALEEDNRRLRAELDEARGSLEEVYKALSA